jgi:uncharacterized OB-fold protein
VSALTSYTKPLPELTPVTRPFWEGARARKLLVQQCRPCGVLRFPPSPVCPECLSPSADWVETSGRARVVSWVVFHQIYFEGFRAEAPYNVALVRLDEGPLLLTNVVGIPNERLEIGMPVAVVFEDATAEVTVPKFRPLEGRQ